MAGGSVGIEGSLISSQNVVRFHSVATKMLMYQWMLIPSMPVAVSLKRWFESNHQYGSVGSIVQLKNEVTRTLNGGYKTLSRLFSFGR